MTTIALDHINDTLRGIAALLADRLPAPPDDPEAPVEGFTETATPLDAYTVGELFDVLIERLRTLGDHGIVRRTIDSLDKLRDCLPDEALHFRGEYK